MPDLYLSAADMEALRRWQWPSERSNEAPAPCTGRVIYACPDCEGDLEEGDFELWCWHCQRAASLADMHVDRESDPWF